jgi:hypothetical protein
MSASADSAPQTKSDNTDASPLIGILMFAAVLESKKFSPPMNGDYVAFAYGDSTSSASVDSTTPSKPDMFQFISILKLYSEGEVLTGLRLTDYSTRFKSVMEIVTASVKNTAGSHWLRTSSGVRFTKKLQIVHDTAVKWASMYLCGKCNPDPETATAANAIYQFIVDECEKASANFVTCQKHRSDAPRKQGFTALQSLVLQAQGFVDIREEGRILIEVSIKFAAFQVQIYTLLLATLPSPAFIEEHIDAHIKLYGSLTEENIIKMQVLFFRSKLDEATNAVKELNRKEGRATSRSSDVFAFVARMDDELNLGERFSV